MRLATDSERRGVAHALRRRGESSARAALAAARDRRRIGRAGVGIVIGEEAANCGPKIGERSQSPPAGSGAAIDNRDHRWSPPRSFNSIEAAPFLSIASRSGNRRHPWCRSSADLGESEAASARKSDRRDGWARWRWPSSAGLGASIFRPRDRGSLPPPRRRRRQGGAGREQESAEQELAEIV